MPDDDLRTPDGDGAPSNSIPVAQDAPPETASEDASPSTPHTAPALADRAELLQRARAFLTSPQVRHEPLAEKRRFLAEKGLSETEVDGLLYEAPPPPPALPPRTYPQPPPSNLPRLLTALFRALTWVAGGSAALLLVYFRFLYPKIARTYQARLSLRTHRRTLLERLDKSLEELKSAQRETWAVLPKPERYRETSFQECHTLDALVEASDGSRDISPITMLRCAIEELTKDGRKPTTPELFNALEAKFPWISTKEGVVDEEKLWTTLSTVPQFESTTDSSSASEPTWSWKPAESPSPPPLVESLASLKSTFPPASVSSPKQSKFHHTLQALSDLTGYISTQTYVMPFAFRAPGLGMSVTLSPEEEEVRREIRALKGLVLNRRSFMPRPNLSRPPSTVEVSHDA